MQVYNAGQVIWNNQYVEITYVGIEKQGNYWGIKLLTENKRDVSLTLECKDVSLDGVIVNKSDWFVCDLPEHRKKFANVVMKFTALENMGIFKIDDMPDIELTLDCPNGLFDTYFKSPLIKLCAEAFSPKEYNYKCLKNMPGYMLAESPCGRNDNAVYIEDNGDVIWDNEYVKLIYLGFYRDDNHWSIGVHLENKTNDEISVTHGPIEMESKVINTGGWPVGHIQPLGETEDHISLMFDEMDEWGIQTLEDFRDLQLVLYCYKQSEKLASSKQIIIHPKEYKESIKTKIEDLSTVHDLALLIEHYNI